jgi:hypothetical protein
MPTFDPQQTHATFGAIDAQGAMDGEFFSAKFRTPRTVLYAGTQGMAALVTGSDRTGEVMWTLSLQSPANRELSIAFAAGMTAMLQMEDFSDGTLVSGPDAKIEDHAEIKRGNTVVGMVWKFLVPMMKIEYTGPGTP